MSSCRGTGSLTNNSRSLRPRSCGLQNTLTKVSLTSRLNLRQPFRILLQGMKHSYVSGDLYTLDLDLNDPNGHAKAVLSLIMPIYRSDERRVGKEFVSTCSSRMLT